jgi:acyl-coenzyme A synthetase/AMP-(fatty) acid ligase
MNFCRVMAGMALRWKDNTAIVNVERDRRYTFFEYHRLTNRIANMCRDRLGLYRGDRDCRRIGGQAAPLGGSPPREWPES